MARGKRDRRETIRSMTVDPDLFDTTIWQLPDPGPDTDGGGDVEPAEHADSETA